MHYMHGKRSITHINTQQKYQQFCCYSYNDIVYNSRQIDLFETFFLFLFLFRLQTF